jgi:hypothetical protein
MLIINIDMLSYDMSDYRYNPNPPLSSDIPVDDTGLPKYYDYKDRAVEVLIKDGISIATTRNGNTTFSLADIIQIGHPITRKEFLTMVDVVERDANKPY